MKLIVISSSLERPGEVDEVIRMFELGLGYYHIRKPRMSRRALAEYITSFPAEYRPRIILHSYHALAYKYRLGGIHMSRKHRHRGRLYRWKIRMRRLRHPGLIVTRTYHKLSDLQNDKRRYTYAFLSPIYDSITHPTLSGGFSKRALLIVNDTARQPILAMGGITPDRLADVHDLGFSGAALHGIVWSADSSPAVVFKQALEAVAVLSSTAQSRDSETGR